MDRSVPFVFMGSDGIALPALRFLRGRSDLLLTGVFTQPDRPSGRGKHKRPNAVKQWAVGEEVPVFQPEKLDAAALDSLASTGAEWILVMAYGHILRKEWLRFPRLGIFNLHASLLPAFRGASPIQASIASGESTGGVSLMRVVRRMDAGPLIDAEPVPIGRRDTGGDLEENLAKACVPLLERNMAALLEGRREEVPQEEEAASYTRKLTKEDGALDFRHPAALLAKRINALYPWPSCHVENKGHRIRIGLADWEDGDPGGEPGTVVKNGPVLGVAAKGGVVSLLQLQRPGGRMMEAAEFLRGHPIAEGTRFLPSPMRPLVSSVPFSSVAG